MGGGGVLIPINKYIGEQTVNEVKHFQTSEKEKQALYFYN